MTRTLHVLIATPFGGDGQGGIDRMMDAVVTESNRRAATDLSILTVPTRGSGSLLASPIYLAMALGRLVAERVAGRCDVLHVNLAQRGSVYRKAVLCGAARLLGIPYVLHLHGSRFDSFWLASKGSTRSLTRAMFRDAAQTLVLGKAWFDLLTQTELAVPARLTILPNATGIPIPAEGRTDGVVRIAFLGKLGERKGTPQLVEALSQLRARRGWTATLAGDGEIEQTLTQVRRLGLEDRVSVPGWIGPAGVSSLLARTDILVLPSFAENLPMSVIEGMAAGLAIVTTPVGATPDIIADGTTGLLVPPGNVAALANALDRLLADERLRHRLGEAARAFHREHLEIGAYVTRLDKIWRDAATTEL